MNFKRIIIRIGLMFSLALYAFPAFAQEGAYNEYTPYSIFSLGELSGQGGARSQSMGGVGIADRNRRYTNYLNPAAVTARDSLSFMADFSLREGNKIMKQGDLTTANNTFNISALSISFPIYRSSAVMIGISPFSSSGYGNYTTIEDSDVLGTAGTTSVSSYGEGSLNQLFLSGGVTFWNRLSLGAEGIYYFGKYEKMSNITFSDASYNGVKSGYNMSLNALGAKFGIQYEQPVGQRGYLGFGATYRTSSNLNGYTSDFVLLNGSVLVDTLSYHSDTLSLRKDRVKIANEIGVGISFRYGEQWRFELDYTRSDWTNCGMNGVPGFDLSGNVKFSTALSQSFKAGFEFTPNINDVRYYFRRCTYRGGVYYNTDYYKVDANTVYKCGITLGATLPVFRLYNGISLGVELGQRGVAGAEASYIKENFINFSIGVNIHDLWFQKYLYK